MKIRTPMTNKGLQTKNAIVMAGMEIFSSRPYKSVTTIDIAKKAGVSTGIVYNYFRNKKDIFLLDVKLYLKKIYEPIVEELNNFDISNISNTIEKIIQLILNAHKNYLGLHEIMDSMRHCDEDVHKLFIDAENNFTRQMVQWFTENGFVIQNMSEKVHIIYNVIEDFCHDFFFHKHDYIDYNKMNIEVKNLILFLLERQ